MNYNTRPTKLQREVFKKVMNEGESVHSAIIKSGGSLATAQNPKNITRSKGWKELMEKELPDGLLAKRHRELLNKREVHVIKIDGKEESELLDQPETQAVSKGLDMAYKLKRKYPTEDNKPNVQVNIGVVMLPKKNANTLDATAETGNSISEN